MEYLPQFPAPLIAGLKQVLAETDRLAYDNVTHDDDGNSILDAHGKPIKGKFARGGPFGAALVISLQDGSFEVIGRPRGNNVVGSGIASRHAEDQALQPDNYRALVGRLTELKKQQHDPFVWMVSSGQSCTNCHTKQEIAARDLEAKGLLKPGRFVTLYGASYDETLKIAQFYDAQYADAIILASQMPHHPDNLIKQRHVEIGAMPHQAQVILSRALIPTAVIMRNGRVYAIGMDERTDYNPFSTAEANAVRNACLNNRAEGVFKSWEVGGELYSLNGDIGPLFHAETSWTNIRTITTAQKPGRLGKEQSRETPKLSDGDFLRVIAGGYRHPMSAIHVVRDGSFHNTAQPKWAEMLSVNNEQLYNGAAVAPAVEAMRDTHTRYRFAADDIDNYTQGRPRRPRQLLESLIISLRDVA
jgi:hypothetical protein